MITSKRSRTIAALSSIVVAATALTAGATSGAAAPVPLAAAKGTPIKFLQTAPVDSPILSFPTYRTGASVAAAAINAAGGINGRPIQIEFCDDKNIPTVAAQCVAQGIAAGVVARVSSVGIQGPVINPLLLNAKLANIGSIPGGGPEFTAPNEYPLSPGTAYGYTAWGKLMKQKYPKAKTAVVMVSDVNLGSTNARLLKQGAEAAGLTVLDEIPVPPTLGDLSSVAGQVSRLKPDIVMASFSAAQVLKWWSASQSIGLQTPFITGPAGQTKETMAQAGAAAAWTSFGDYYPNQYSNVAGAAVFRAQMAKYAAGQPITRDAWVSWIGVTALASIMQSMKGPITPSTVWGTISRVKCLDVLYFKCLNLSKPGPIPAAPTIRVTTEFMSVIKNGDLAPTPYIATAG